MYCQLTLLFYDTAKFESWKIIQFQITFHDPNQTIPETSQNCITETALFAFVFITQAYRPNEELIMHRSISRYINTAQYSAVFEWTLTGEFYKIYGA